MKYIILFSLVFLSGCANMKNPALDHKIVCGLDGHAAFVVTYGPVAFTNDVPDADALCGSMQKSTAVIISAPAVSASGVK